MHTGLCLLRLPPETFWAMTPVEFVAMTGGLRARGAALSRVRMEGLMASFPDDGTAASCT